MRKHAWPLIPAVLLAAFAAPRTLCAGTVLPTTEVAFQALTTDMLAATFNIDIGFDPGSVFSYQGTFDQTGWSGTFGGTFEGQPVGGTMTATVVGDPNYVIGGTTTWKTGKNTEAGPPITMTMAQVAGKPNQFNLKNTTIGQQTWKTANGFPLRATAQGNEFTLSGTVYRQNANGIPLGTYRAQITVDTVTNQVLSTFTSVGGPQTQVITDRGNYSEANAGGGFNGAMNEMSTVGVPEPSGLLMLAIGTVGLLAGVQAARRFSGGRHPAAM